MLEVDRDAAKEVQAVLGNLYSELIEVMLDVDTAPIYLDSDDRPRLVRIRDKAKGVLQQWFRDDPATAASVTSRLTPDLSILEVATWYDYFEVPGAALRVPLPNSRVFTAVPHLWSRLDKDGLLHLEDLDAQPHGIFVDDYSLQYHQLMRRGFHSAVHTDLVALVLSIGEREDVTARLAIDERRLRLRSEHQEYFERDYWFGPPLRSDLIDDPSEIGDSYFANPGPSRIDPYVGLSTRWTWDGVSKTVEIEEYVLADASTESFVLARYLHAIRDISKHCFVHCDAAVKAYDRTTYPKVPALFRERGKGLDYRKVLRLDGHLSTEDWSRVTASWFRGNTLILEYLAGSPASAPRDIGSN